MNESLKELRYTRDLVALEAFQVAGVNLSELLRRTFPSLHAAFGRITTAFSPSDPAVKLDAHENTFVRLVATKTYLQLSPLKAYVPEGLDETYLNYAGVLDQAVKHSVEGVDRLSRFSTFLALLVTNRDQQLTTKTNAKTYIGLEKDREGLNKELGQAFKNGSHTTDVTYGDVIARNSDWPGVFNATEKLTREINAVDRKALIAKVKETADLMEKITKMAQSGSLDNVTPEVLQELADGAYQIASELEFFSITYYRVLAYTTAVNRTISEMTRKIQGM